MRPVPDLEPPQGGGWPLLSLLLRHRYALLVALSAALLIAGSSTVTVDNDWHFFVFGSDLLVGDGAPLVRSSYTVFPDKPGGLHLYASYPFLQIGPPALLLAALLSLGPDDGLQLAAAAVQALGLLFVAIVERTFPRRGLNARLASFGGSVFVVAAWTTLAHYRHLDDALALTAAAGAVWAVQQRMPVAFGLLAGVAAASKPWGVVVLGLAFALTGSRPRLTAVAAGLGVAAAFWAPFVLADTGTLEVGRLALAVAADSPLVALHAVSLAESGYLRPAQLVIGLALSALLAARGHASTALLTAFAFRLSIDPGAYLYYGAAVLAAAYVADAGRPAGRAPAWTPCLVGFYVAALVTSGDVAGFTRLVGYVGAVMVATGLAVLRPRELSHGT